MPKKTKKQLNKIGPEKKRKINLILISALLLIIFVFISAARGDFFFRLFVLVMLLWIINALKKIFKKLDS